MNLQARKIHRIVVGFGVACAVAAALPCVAGDAAAAKDSGPKSKAAPVEANIGLVSGLAIGAVAGGPAGAVVGGIAGLLIGQHEHQRKALNHERTASLNDASDLTLNVAFRTGDSQLTPDDIDQLTKFGRLAGSMAGVTARVSGHADPRGAKEYNTMLSQQRADSVAAVLQSAGLDKDRISVEALGADAAATGSLDDYALQRRVSVTLFAPKPKAGAAPEELKASTDPKPEPARTGS
jgi:outer membrane protein OmpA-like peptidoglycan-associated protein